MSTVLEILNVTTDFFKKNKVPDARLDAQYILAHGLKMKRMDLYLNFDRPLTESELSTLRPLVARRAKREPLQHIIGNTSFRGFLINCDKRALIPRPETEMMVDFVIQESSLPKEMLIADIGTGTGAIAIALAKEISSAKILAVDISNEAITLAKENAALNQVEDRISFFEGSLLSALPAECKPNVIVANLPYIPLRDKESLQEEVRLFDPALALFGGEDGLDLIRFLLKETKDHLASNGFIWLEIASGQEKLLQKEISLYPWLSYCEAIDDFVGNTRFVKIQSKE